MVFIRTEETLKCEHVKFQVCFDLKCFFLFQGKSLYSPLPKAKQSKHVASLNFEETLQTIQSHFHLVNRLFRGVLFQRIFLYFAQNFCMHFVFTSQLYLLASKSPRKPFFMPFCYYCCYYMDIRQENGLFRGFFAKLLMFILPHFFVSA